MELGKLGAALTYISKNLHFEKLTIKQIQDISNYFSVPYSTLYDAIQKRIVHLPKPHESINTKELYMTKEDILAHKKKGDLNKHRNGNGLWSMLEMHIVDSEFYRMFCANNKLKRINNKRQPVMSTWNLFIDKI